MKQKLEKIHKKLLTVSMKLIESGNLIAGRKARNLAFEVNDLKRMVDKYERKVE